MKNMKINKYWKVKKRYGFHFYFVLFTSIVVVSTVSLSVLIANLIEKTIKNFIEIPDFILLISFSIIIGIILSIFIGKILILPINKLKKLMIKVANGDLDTKAEEKSIIDEVEDMYHYFNLMMSELRVTETIQSDFISNVSHEFKTPLNAIDGYATLLSNKDLTEEEKELYVNKILYNTRRMNKLIGNILLLSKVDNQAIDSKKVLYSLDEQIRQSIVSLEPQWAKKNIDFDVDLETINYYGNEGIMIHVWNNLIGNAIKFSPKNSIIKILLKKDNDKIIFIVEDNGIGISEEEKKHIFNKFYQIDTSHKSEGNGLGLSLVKKILDISNGVIEVENVYPNGSKFKVIL